MVSDAEDEVFLSLEEEQVTETPQAPQPKPSRKKKKPSRTKGASTQGQPPVLEAEILDTSIIEQATGAFEVGWPLLGMDCPDCASKAVRALKTLPQTNDVMVSATAGTVRFNVDLEQGHMAEVSSVLRSLGHAPDLEFNELVGVNATSVAARNGVDRRKLSKVLRQQPGVLDVEISDDDRIVLQLVSNASKEIFDKRDKALEHVTGPQSTLLLLDRTAYVQTSGV